MFLVSMEIPFEELTLTWDVQWPLIFCLLVSLALWSNLNFSLPKLSRLLMPLLGSSMALGYLPLSQHLSSVVHWHFSPKQYLFFDIDVFSTITNHTAASQLHTYVVPSFIFQLIFQLLHCNIKTLLSLLLSFFLFLVGSKSPQRKMSMQEKEEQLDTKVKIYGIAIFKLSKLTRIHL